MIIVFSPRLIFLLQSHTGFALNLPIFSFPNLLAIFAPLIEMFANSIVIQNCHLSQYPSNGLSGLRLPLSPGGSSQAISPHSELSISSLFLYSSLHLPSLWALSYCHRVACLLISLSQYSMLLVCEDYVFFNLCIFKTMQHDALAYSSHSINICLSNKIIHEVHLLM